MRDPTMEKPGWKHRVKRELIEYWINVAYLFVFFGAFTTYRRLVLAAYNISYIHYGYAFFKALVLAKVVMIGDFLGLAGQLREKPLIVTTLYKAVVFAVWVIFFNAVERVAVDGLLHGKGLGGGFHLVGAHLDELLASALVVFFAFIPFFAFKELGRVLGARNIAWLFFRKRTALKSELSLCKAE
ncbi:MAG: hypothetical protein P4L55_21755 [Syntrophobacteraceae bacterium]|nr:hypothetical protein [Syntrophobacteraceae bacterium]